MYYLRSSYNNQLAVPRMKSTLTTYGVRSFAVSGPTAWNNLPNYLSDEPGFTFLNSTTLKLPCLLTAQCNSYANSAPVTFSASVPHKSIVNST